MPLFKASQTSTRIKKEKKTIDGGKYLETLILAFSPCYFSHFVHPLFCLSYFFFDVPQDTV
jgi:hypothetical protein